MLTVEETNELLPTTELTMEVAKVVSCKLVVAVTVAAVGEDAVATSMVRVLVGVTVTYIVIVVHMVVVDITSSTTLVASPGENVVVVAPVIVNSSSLILIVAVVSVVTVSSIKMGELMAVLVAPGIVVVTSI
jgi:hypothetical protein